MNIDQIKEIIKAAPFNLYTKQSEKTRVIFNNGSDVYINLLDLSITVGLGIFNSLKDLTEDEVRTVFYHEVSHAILTDYKVIDVHNFNKADIIKTAKDLNLSVNKDNLKITIADMKSLLNIIEDERIETILKDYYLDVDFKHFVKKLNEGATQENAMSKFYSALRLDEGQYHNKSKELLKPLLKHPVKSEDYLPLLALYAHMYEANEEEEQDNQQGDGQHSDDNQQSNGQNSEQNNLTQEDIEQIVDKALEDKKEAQKQAAKENAERKAYEDAMNNLNSIDNLIKKITLKAKTKDRFGTNAKSHSYINSNVDIHKAINMKENQYKIFNRKLPNNKGNETITLNFFIDRSGSYYENEQKTNELLAQLETLEEKFPGFKFTLTTISHNDEYTYKENETRRISCDGGTSISYKFKDIFNKLHSDKNPSILLIDGFTYIEDANLDYLDKRNLYICSDESNNEYFSHFTKAKVDLVTGAGLYNKTYSDYLEDFIKRTLSSILRKM